MRHRSALGAVILLVSALAAGRAEAAPILAPPSDTASYNAAVGALAAGYQLQQDTFAALQFGLSLDVYVTAAEVPTVQAFFAQTATTDFETFSGKKPFSVLDTYEEYGDIGNFAGIASVGVAARLMALKAEKAPFSEIEAARVAAVAAAKAWHVYGAIGGPGVVARGIQRTKPLDPSTGPLPGTLPALTPLKDAMGNALPNPKTAVWRAPVAPGFDGWIWLDDTSKDQVSGYALASAWLWDALVGDAAVDPSVTQGLADDLVAFAKALMKPAPELQNIDLCIRDADGRLTDFHDLNPRQITPDSVTSPTSPLQNGFNAAMALGVIRAAYHVSGDPVVGRYYYEELIGKRGYADLFGDASLMYTGPSTNYSNVNMAAISYALLGRFETDPTLRAKFAKWVEKTFWSVEASYDAESVQQAWFDAVYAGVSAHPTATIRVRVANNLGGFPVPPAFNVARENCTPADISAGSCIGVDGKTKITLVAGDAGHGGSVVATEPVPMSIRPLSDFLWRSDPHQVNGGGPTNLLDPGGDFLAAYWLSRVIDLDDPSKNLTPNPRPPYVVADAGAEAGAKDAAEPSPEASTVPPKTPSSGCSCDVGGAPAAGFAAASGLVLVLGALARRRASRRA